MSSYWYLSLHLCMLGKWITKLFFTENEEVTARMQRCIIKKCQTTEHVPQPRKDLSLSENTAARPAGPALKCAYNCKPSITSDTSTEQR